MTVHGYSLTCDQVAAGIAAIVDGCVFADVVAALREAGVPAAGLVADRAADRLLQRERLARRIRFDPQARVWRRVTQ